MDQNINYYGIILLLRQLRESGSFSEKELREVRPENNAGTPLRHGLPRTAARTS